MSDINRLNSSMNLLRKCLAEAIGSFAIVFGGCGAIAINQISDGSIGHTGIALSFGLIVMTMIYAMGHISGAHFNPAVTLGFALARHFPLSQILPYLLAQCTGALIASSLHSVLLKPIALSKGLKTLNYGVTQPIDQSMMTACCWEAILTFFLMLVIMAVATDFRAMGQMAGLAIGGTVAFLALFAGPLEGASMNPVRSLGPACLQGDYQFLLAYIVGPTLGAIAGALTYGFIRCESKKDSQVKGCC